ncbi:S-adenosyl-L-methionine-dependent methyltransferase [Lentinula edodes]|uniref:S-adenosyl-L-methionine-dependent methyltransferase n=1 Tax=Lentinula lateritia TaxID=40482 RepID=A0A9W8ZZU5_9AGAR|nr:S-adenosyl-L-methionine-dependent methyltransferase [Lentinula edodes]
MSAKLSDPLKSLVDIISTQTAVLQSAYSKNNTEAPSLDTTFQPSLPEFDPSVVAARHLIVAAATQLIATVQSPVEFLQSHAGRIYDTVTLGFVIDVNIPEILNEAGTQGLHVRQISSITGVESSYLARVLRYLATRHIFKEVSPDVFAHNRPSSMLTKAKSLKAIEEDPIGRFDNAAIPAFLHITSDELLNSSVPFTSFVKNPGQASAPFNIAYKTSKKMWEWMEEPGNELSARKITAAMKDTGDAMYPPEIFTSGIDGDALKTDDVVVDVGGGSGLVTLALKKAYPKLRYVIQDLAPTIAAAGKVWDEKDPEAVKIGQVQLQVHNFFTPQPIKDAAVYFLRLIIHDWPDEDARKILAHLRSAAGSHSKLILFEMLAKHVTEGLGSGPSAPYPLLPNFGAVGAGFFTTLDMALLTMYNGKERTLEEYTQLGRESGWKLKEVKPGKLTAFVFTPI